MWKELPYVLLFDINSWWFLQQIKTILRRSEVRNGKWPLDFRCVERSTRSLFNMATYYFKLICFCFLLSCGVSNSWTHGLSKYEEILFSKDGYLTDLRQETIDPNILGGIRIQLEAHRLSTQIRSTCYSELGTSQMQVSNVISIIWHNFLKISQNKK